MDNINDYRHDLEVLLDLEVTLDALTFADDSFDYYYEEILKKVACVRTPQFRSRLDRLIRLSKVPGDVDEYIKHSVRLAHMRLMLDDVKGFIANADSELNAVAQETFAAKSFLEVDVTCTKEYIHPVLLDALSAFVPPRPLK